jgi:hypothetical protein
MSVVKRNLESAVQKTEGYRSDYTNQMSSIMVLVSPFPCGKIHLVDRANALDAFLEPFECGHKICVKRSIWDSKSLADEMNVRGHYTK